MSLATWKLGRMTTLRVVVGVLSGTTLSYFAKLIEPAPIWERLMRPLVELPRGVCELEPVFFERVLWTN